MSPRFPWTLQLTSLTPDPSPSTLSCSGVTNLTHNLPGDSYIASTQVRVQLCGTSKDSRDLRKHSSEQLSLRRQALTQLVEEAFSSWVGMREAPQNPSNVTQSQPLTVTLEGHLKHTAIPLSGVLHVA